MKLKFTITVKVSSLKMSELKKKINKVSELLALMAADRMDSPFSDYHLEDNEQSVYSFNAPGIDGSLTINK